MKNINVTLVLAILCFLVIIGIVIFLYCSLKNQPTYGRFYFIINKNKSDIKQNTDSTPHNHKDNLEYNNPQSQHLNIESCTILEKNNYSLKVVNENSNFNENLNEHNNTALKVLLDYLKFTNRSKKATVFNDMDKELKTIFI
jgi:hypothetical protein